MPKNLKIIDLFSGIGGFSLAARRINWQTVAFVEKDVFCQKVLRKNFGQDIEIYDDITTFSGKPFRGRCDVVTGGFPCQPFSIAGQKLGKNDERHLFPEMLRVVEEVRPSWVVAENVRGLLGIESGQVFEEVAASLESIGYAVQTFCIPASAVNAPHRRDRIWIIADTDGDRQQRQRELGRCRGAKSGKKRQTDFAFNENQFQKNWLQAATRFCRVDDVIPNRVDRLKSLGNSIVPQIAYEIFKAIEQTDSR